MLKLMFLKRGSTCNDIKILISWNDFVLQFSVIVLKNKHQGYCLFRVCTEKMREKAQGS